MNTKQTFTHTVISVTDSAIIKNSIQVEFSSKGWKQLERLNRKLGKAYLRAYVLSREIRQYIELQREAGVLLDGKGQELVYEDGICVLIRADRGSWSIIDIWSLGECVEYKPVFIWRRIRQGLRDSLSHVFAGWRTFANRKAKEYDKANHYSSAGHFF